MLEVKNVSKTYQINKDNQVQALKGVSLNFKNNGLYFILGKSGCGKSTLLNLLAGLDNVTQGEIWLNGKDLTKFTANELNNYRNLDVGFIFQEFNLIPNLNVRENIAISLKMQGKKVEEEEIITALKTVEMEGFANRKINELSGGQKQRIAIARAIIKKPKIIFADEPTGALDSETAEQIFSLLKSLSNDHLIIIVSHDEEFAKKYADELILLKDGCIEKEQTLREIKNNDIMTRNDENSKCYLPFFTSLKLGFSNLKFNIVRLVIIIILSVTSFVCLGVAITAYQYDKEKLIANSIADSGYTDPLAIMSFEKKSSTSKQGTIFPNMIDDLNKELAGFYIGVYQGIDKTNLNFKEEVTIDYFGTYDALSLFSLNGISIINPNIQKELGYNIYGNIPTKDNEILITEYFYETFVKYGYSNGDDVVERNISKEDMIGKVIQVPKYRLSDINIEYVVCGIIDTEFDTKEFEALTNYSNDNENLKEAKRLVYSYQKNSIHSVGFVSQEGMDLLNVYGDKGFRYDAIVSKMPKDKKTLVNTMKYLNKISNDEIQYHLVNTTDDWINNVDNMMGAYKMLGGIAGAVLSVFSILLLFNYINLSINHKKKEMGILRALGARGFDILKVFGCEGIFITTINWLLSMLGTFIFLSIIDKGIRKEYFLNTNVYSFNILTALLLLLISIIACVISISYPIYKVSKKSPIQTIQN